MTQHSYLGFVIVNNPSPTPIRSCDWQFWHESYDGPEDWRCGTAATLDDAKAAVRQHWLDISPMYVDHDNHDQCFIVKDARGFAVHYAATESDAEHWIIMNGWEGATK